MLPYTSETVADPQGQSARVLDASSVDFKNAAMGRKKAETLVHKAMGGEEIVTRNKAGQVESTYVAQAGDVIFVNLHNRDDVYVPGKPDGSRMKFDRLKHEGYEVVGDDKSGGVRVKSAVVSPLLTEAVTEPTCIKDAWGVGNHQFLYAGATLKKNADGAVTGIDKTAFDATWEITSPPPVPRGANPGKPNPARPA
jgi:hypothetical protein